MSATRQGRKQVSNFFQHLRENEIANRKRAPKDKQEAEFVPEPTHQPTTVYPSTWDKVEVLAQRLEQGQSLWHPDDVGGGGDFL